VAEVEAMSCTASPSVKQVYGAARVLRVWELPRSSFYHRRRQNQQPTRTIERRGPKTPYSDAELTEKIRVVLAESPFHGEGYRKVWARLRYQQQVRTSKGRVLRLMREAQLLAPSRRPAWVEPNAHTGTIVTERPNQMWGTDATAAQTLEQGQVTIFVAVDHCTAECVGIHAAKPATRFEALEPIRQGVRAMFGGFAAGVAAGLQVRHDHGSQYMSDAFQAEIRFLGIESSPAFVRQPEGNGCVERFIRTLKEQLLWLRSFRNVEELREALVLFQERYNEHWLIERNSFRSPRQARQDFLAIGAAA
jgi:putative transposase